MLQGIRSLYLQNNFTKYPMMLFPERNTQKDEKKVKVNCNKYSSRKMNEWIGISHIIMLTLLNKWLFFFLQMCVSFIFRGSGVQEISAWIEHTFIFIKHFCCWNYYLPWHSYKKGILIFLFNKKVFGYLLPVVFET
jgi:hypothetical protein